MNGAPLKIRLRNSLIHGFTRVLMATVRILPEKASYRLGRGLALFAWLCMPNWRRTSVRGLEIFYAAQHPAQYQPPTEPMRAGVHGSAEARREYARIARQSAINLGYLVIEFIRAGFLEKEEALRMIVRAEGLEHFPVARAKGRGSIGMSIHFGNWEIAGAFLATQTELYPVGKEQRDEFFTKLAFPWRARFGMKNIYAGDKVNSAILRTLKNNHTLGLLADQNGGKRGVFVPFAGTLASTPPGPAVLSMRTGAPLLLTYCRRIEPGKFVFHVRPPLNLDGVPGFDPETGQHTDESVVEVLTRMNAVYESVIREDPTQWLWGHKRWKTRPPGEDWIY